jgi:solute carrier family 25 protein 14/30
MTKLLKNVFCAGCAAVLTVTFIHPIDVVKTRIQVESNKGNSAGIGGVVKGALDTEGAGAFYKGIKPAWLREMSYSSLRIGLYDPVKILVGANNPGASFLQKFLAGAIAGAIGCTAGNPFDILKTKMMADKEAKNKGIGEYASEIMKFQGFMGFYKGYNTNVIRAMVNNASAMACYDIIKTWMINMFALEGILLQFLASFAAGFFITMSIAPFDKARTVLMN